MVRVYPPAEHKQRLMQMLGVSRFIYNECVEMDRQKLIDGASNKELYRVRTLLTKKENYAEKAPWKDTLPSLAKQKAVEEFFQGKKEALKRCAKGGIFRFAMKKRSRFKDRQQTISFERHQISGSGRFVNAVIDRKKVSFRVRGKVPSEFKDTEMLRKEMKMVKTRLGKWFLVVPIVISMKPKYAGRDDGEVCALDPGVRSFQTVYGTDGVVTQIGESFDPIEEALHKADYRQSLLTKHGKNVNARKRRHLKRHWLHALEKVRNRIRDLHNKVAHWLCENYRVILIPEFRSSEMVTSKRLPSPVCRAMMTWSHYSFRRRLIDLAQRFTDVKVRVVSEAYTTQTCGACGIRTNPGTSKEFRCSNSSCGAVFDRDENAARNILLRNLENIVE